MAGSNQRMVSADVQNVVEVKAAKTVYPIDVFLMTCILEDVIRNINYCFWNFIDKWKSS